MMNFSLIAHRGASAEMPENTLPAFERALALGVDYIELDYHLTADSQMAVIHDALLDRTTNAASHPDFGPCSQVRAFRFDQLQQLNAADWPDGRWAKTSSTQIPLLKEALEMIVVKGNCRCIIEHKSNDAKVGPLSLLIQQFGIADQCVITSACWSFLNDCRNTLPELRVAYQLSPDQVPDFAMAKPNQILFCDHSMLTPTAIERFMKQHQLQVWAWTVNDPRRAEQLAKWGVTGICTNDPAAMKEAF